MNRLIWILILASTGLVTYSQEPVNPPPSNAQVSANAYRLLLSNPHRVKLTVEFRDTQDASWEEYSVQTREANGQNWRSVQHTGSRIEAMRFGDRVYRKFPGGEWQLISVEQSVGTPVRVASPPAAGATLIPTRVTVIESTSTSKIVTGDGKAVDIVITRKEWFDESGRFTRVVVEHFNFEKRKFQRVTEEYEYDPTIRIVAPVAP